MDRIHFISGLPRSGSTLLGALLKQNPDAYANMSGPMAAIVTGLLAKMSGENEFAIFIDEVQRKAILQGAFANYYDKEQKRLIFDTNRLWCSKMPAIAELFPNAKIIACVRETAWIIDSIERIVSKSPLQMSKIFNFDASGTVFARADQLSRADGLVGFAMNALKEAFYGAQAGNLMLLRYETLTSRPAEAMAAVYDFIGEKPFQHDFDNVVFGADEFDERLGTPGLHRVGSKVKFEQRQTILPPEIFGRYANDDFYNNPAVNTRGVLIV